VEAGEPVRKETHPGECRLLELPEDDREADLPRVCNRTTVLMWSRPSTRKAQRSLNQYWKPAP